MARKIILEPFGGLANRLRVIATGIALKKQYKAKLEVVWNENYELNCPFSLLFEPINEFTIIPKKHIYKHLSSSNKSDGFIRLKRLIKNKLAGVDLCITEQDFPWDDVFKQLSNYNTSYIQTCQRLNEDDNYFELFKPIPEIAQKIRLLTNQFNSDTIGVQIRRTDNQTSINNSPLELFIARMQQLIDQNTQTNFFLTTDDQDVEDQIKNQFGQRILSHPKEQSRQSVKGMQDAVADIFTLSKTSKILGSYWSSFSEIAAQLGRIPLEVIKK